MVGLIDNIKHRITPDFKDNGDSIILLGETLDECGGSEYLKLTTGKIAGRTPNVSPETEKRIINLLFAMNKMSIIKSASDCSEGGLAITIARCAIAGDKGARLNMKWRYRPDIELFSESQHRIVITSAHKHIDKIKEMARNYNIPCTMIGVVRGKSLTINNMVSVSVEELKNAYNRGL
jgi:phosphoribosylformylglycinamidine synthase